MKTLYSLLVLLAIVTTATAQYKVSGTILDSKDRQPLAGATAILTPVGGGQPQGQSTDSEGNFTIVRIPNGNYVLKVKFVGYEEIQKEVTVKDTDLKLGTLKIKQLDKELEEVKAVGTLVRQEQRGDTTVFNADAFKVNPDATTEDLLKKIPGMQVSSDGTVKHGGETVKKVLVDGKEFFGSDPSIALKNIDASMVKQIEVFDKQSEQAEFTGFSDGNEERTINILTKMGIKSGRFGRVYGGYGTGKHYELGGSINYFRGEHRVSVLGMLNNVNQQNFSFDDVTGAMANGGGRSMGGMSRGKNGINTTGAVGVNYNFEREKKLKIETSYFFNYNRNKSHSESYQEYFSDNQTDSIHTYEAESNSKNHNYNHRANLRLTWTINDNNTLSIIPSISWQKYDDKSTDYGEDFLDLIGYQRTDQADESNTTGYSFSGELNWRHRFSIPRRTFSIRATTSVNNSAAEANSQSSQIDEEEETATSGLVTSQITTNDSKSYKYGAKLQYTEPFGEHVALQINYDPSYTVSKGDKSVDADSVVTTNTADVVFSNYQFSDILSNKKESYYLIHRGGVGANVFNGRVFNATVGVDFQYSILDGDQTYPYEFETHHTFRNIMPSAELRLNKDRKLNMRFSYRTSSSAPSISQLQNVVDVSNIRKYTGGNEDLEQSTSHSFTLRGAANNVETSRFMFLMTRFTTTKNYIATASMIASQDSIIDHGITLPSGTQYTKPVNMDGYLTASINLTMSTPVNFLGSNFSLNLGADLNKKPSMYNYKEVTNKTNSVSMGATLSSSFSENIDFNIGYNGKYNIVKSTQTVSSNYNYYNHTANADLTWLFVNQRLVFTNSLAHNMTSGMGDDYDTNYLTWNASLGVKFFKDRRGELKLRVNDILDSVESIQRSIQDAYVQTSSTDVLGRYAMLTFTYKFKTIGEMPQRKDGPPGGFRGGMGGPGGGGFGGGRPM